MESKEEKDRVLLMYLVEECNWPYFLRKKMIGGIRFPVQIRSDLTNREREKKEANSIFFSLFDVIQHHSGYLPSPINIMYQALIMVEASGLPFLLDGWQPLRPIASFETRK